MNTEIFSKNIIRKMANESRLHENSNYDNKFIVNKENTIIQIKTVEELINLVEIIVKVNKGKSVCT